ncbi:hypothetical protein HaLaN_01690 [Haematococcus lacustris]|uniref:Uncharacterized protein n=1 Tax=Haematococcus lacustris TaxID=44745 RepID=A0A699YVB0_HAELA|nr:hypothetical protein HaLaN_01690 [Haematococcus lacustris]
MLEASLVTQYVAHCGLEPARVRPRSAALAKTTQALAGLAPVEYKLQGQGLEAQRGGAGAQGGAGLHPGGQAAVGGAADREHGYPAPHHALLQLTANRACTKGLVTQQTSQSPCQAGRPAAVASQAAQPLLA